MKIMMMWLSAAAVLLACTGDCMTCHPALEKTIHSDERHKPMLTCINCHGNNPDAMAECGSDCFACHTMEKIEGVGIKEHAVIRGCRDCHMKMKAELFDMKGPPSQSRSNEINGFLLP